MLGVRLVTWFGSSQAADAYRLGLGQLRLSGQQVGEAEQQRQPVAVLGQAAIAHPVAS